MWDNFSFSSRTLWTLDFSFSSQNWGKAFKISLSLVENGEIVFTFSFSSWSLRTETRLGLPHVEKNVLGLVSLLGRLSVEWCFHFSSSFSNCDCDKIHNYQKWSKCWGWYFFNHKLGFKPTPMGWLVCLQPNSVLARGRVHKVQMGDQPTVTRPLGAICWGPDTPFQTCNHASACLPVEVGPHTYV